jgi:hypothetical protein
VFVNVFSNYSTNCLDDSNKEIIKFGSENESS